MAVGPATRPVRKKASHRRVKPAVDSNFRKSWQPAEIESDNARAFCGGSPVVLSWFFLIFFDSVPVEVGAGFDLDPEEVEWQYIDLLDAAGY